MEVFFYSVLLQFLKECFFFGRFRGFAHLSAQAVQPVGEDEYQALLE
jgi:hypothetical protein